MEAVLANLALFQHEPYCSRDCCDGITTALGRHHSIERIGLRDLSLQILSSFDLLIFPGGRGEASAFRTLLRRHVKTVQDYVAQGGRYLGICMGAYWADARYFNLLESLRCEQYITRPQAEIRRSYPTLARINWQYHIHTMYFFDGCTFTGDATSATVIATYANGDPMALIQNRVGVIGCHPESEAHWYHTKALQKAWHEFRHHRLLLEFVEKMLTDETNTITAQAYPDPHAMQAALSAIMDLTAPFARGTYQKINDLARTALSQPTPKK